MSSRVIRARYTEQTIRVYQAYSPDIAAAALKAGRFVPPFKMERMTWIKPSFNWMMYRCGYGSKPDQEVVLAIDITRSGFDAALRQAAPAKFYPEIHKSHDAWQSALDASPVRVQWDPERDWKLNVIPNVRSIQIGISGQAVASYVNEWIVSITDVTELAYAMARARESDAEPPERPDQCELPYPVDQDIQRRLLIDSQ